jgi:hypothetical protein
MTTVAPQPEKDGTYMRGLAISRLLREEWRIEECKKEQYHDG